ncbi:MAG: hypothetical protein H8D70_02120 [Rhodospirillaceae bacterium]|nr:hypothetical protein [Rhodospirillaceae bacterium]
MEAQRENYAHVTANRETYVGAVNDAISTETKRYEERQRERAAKAGSDD